MTATGCQKRPSMSLLLSVAGDVKLNLYNILVGGWTDFVWSYKSTKIFQMDAVLCERLSE